MSLRDQASKLREMMNIQVKRQDNCIPVAVFSCGDGNQVALSKRIAWHTVKMQGKEAVHINADSSEAMLKEMTEKEGVWSQMESLLDSSYVEIDENFSDMYEKMREKQNIGRYVNALSRIERNKEVLWYYCGNSINAKAMNLMAMSSIVVLFVEDDKRSVQTARNTIKVQRKLQQNSRFYLVGLDMEEQQLRRIVAYLQQVDSLLLEHHVQGMGTVSSEGNQRDGNEKEIDWHAISIPMDGKNKSLSERLDSME